ncbi:hypothetical protein OJAV_G00011540 [Oryzias javanicus]|uniref:Uncharacterized protein n=1 Tax=Oryzias javanicus TaxID=123683 RepID=A0A437DNZ4_ORYJA|nr:hypothetical protein OJAV_G00011540 [Oryzias javanicus]
MRCRFSPLTGAERSRMDWPTLDDHCDLNYNYAPQAMKPLAICSSPSSSSSPPSSPSSRVPATAHFPPTSHVQTRSVAMAMPTSPWLVNDLGEPVCAVVAPPPYSYDPSGSDLPRDCRVLQYYFNLGVQWCHQSCWQQQLYPPAVPDGPYQHYGPYLSQEPPLHASPVSLAESGRGPHPPPYSDPPRMSDGQLDGHGVVVSPAEGAWFLNVLQRLMGYVLTETDDEKVLGRDGSAV